MLYLLDTSVCVSFLRGHAKPDDLPDTGCAISVITLAELEVGVCRSNRPQQQRRFVDALLEILDVLPFEPRVASVYGNIRASLERVGKRIGTLDLLIAAHAFSRNATLVTGNVGEFSRIQGLSVLPWP